jgi:hypothetical protein
MGHYAKLPHQYAREFIKARGNQDKQKSIIESAPKEWLPLIKTHIKNQREWAEHERNTERS